MLPWHCATKSFRALLQDVEFCQASLDCQALLAMSAATKEYSSWMFTVAHNKLKADFTVHMCTSYLVKGVQKTKTCWHDGQQIADKQLPNVQ